jgi:6-phospho-beta-glucosidase
MKVTVIGGGSTYTPELVEGLALWQLQGGPQEVCLHDTDLDRLDKVAGFSARMSRALNSGLKVTAEADFDRALRNASFVVFQIRVGGQEARHEDIRMGIDRGLIGQETTGVGGFAKALRTIPIILDMVRRVRDANRDAWIINFTNPSGIVTEAICRFATTRCVGLCNVPKEFHMDVARHLRVEEQEIEVDWVGLNHLGWARRIMVKGENVLPYLIKALESDYGPKNIPDLEYPDGFLAALGMLPSSYVRYFYMPDAMLKEIKDKPKSRAEEVMEIENQLLDYYADENNTIKPMQLSQRGGAWYSRIAVDVMGALRRPEPQKLIVNTPNLGAIEGLPGDASVEIPCEVSSAGVKPLPVAQVEESIMGLMRQVKSYERLTIEAAIGRDEDKALMALMNNPLVPSIEKAMEIVDAVKARGLL